MKKQYSEIINAPIDSVFGSITDRDHFETLSKKQEHQIQFKNAHDFSDPVGSKFHEKIANLVEFDAQVLAYNKPREFGFGLEVLGLRGTIYYELTELEPNKTRLEFKLELYDSSPSKKLVIKTSWPLFNMAIKGTLATIKEHAETR